MNPLLSPSRQEGVRGDATWLPSNWCMFDVALLRRGGGHVELIRI